MGKTACPLSQLRQTTTLSAKNLRVGENISPRETGETDNNVSPARKLRKKDLPNETGEIDVSVLREERIKIDKDEFREEAEPRAGRENKLPSKSPVTDN